jgi:ABC-2 type transport system permease protein
MTIFTRLLADRRRGAIWWAIGMVFGVAVIVGLWPSVKDAGDIQKLVDDLPTSVRALIGSQAGISLDSAAGYLQARLFATTLPILMVVYAIGLGAGTIGAAEEDGTLQLTAVAPVSRRRIAVQRLAGSATLLLLVAGVGLITTLGLGIAVGIDDDVSLGRLALGVVAVTELALLHLVIAAAVGAATGRRGPALSLASAVAVGTYVIYGLAASAKAVEPLRTVSPWWWLLDRNLLVQDPTFLALGLPLVLSALIAGIGVVAYERRDLRFP